jgi:hypothetical protein
MIKEKSVKILGHRSGDINNVRNKVQWDILEVILRTYLSTDTTLDLVKDRRTVPVNGLCLGLISGLLVDSQQPAVGQVWASLKSHWSALIRNI